MKCKSMHQISALITYMKENFSRTGSRVFGVATDKSDFDYVATNDEAQDMCKTIGVDFFKCKNIEEYASTFISVKYSDFSDAWHNLIIVPHEIDLMAWQYATTEICKLPKKSIMLKKDRTREFGFLPTEFYRDTILPPPLQKLCRARLQDALAMWGER